MASVVRLALLVLFIIKIFKSVVLTYECQTGLPIFA